MKKVLTAVVVFFVLGMGSLFAGGGDEAGRSSDGRVAGPITVLTNRTDLVDTLFADYARRFNQIYPDVQVNFEAMTDYSGIVKIRMNTKDYGDVLLIPDGVTPPQLGDFFEPLGPTAEMAKKYLMPTEQAYQGTTYGIPVSVNANGIVYNKRIFREAGITELPNTPEEFLEALEAIKANTDAIPYYTNYASGWALTQWEAHRSSVAGDPDFVNSLAHTDAPFAPGEPHYIVYKLMYDIVARGLAEADPTTTDWESSKARLGNGEIATMVLGSWAIPQIQALADDPSDVGYMPFPYNNNGIVSAASGGDYKLAVNIHSKNKPAALAWLYWFVEESGFAKETGGIPPVVGGEVPESLQAFADLGVNFVSNNPAPAGEEGWVDEIDREGEIGLWEPNFKARIIEAAFGARNETFDQIMADLNEDWKAARAVVTP